MNEEWTVKVKYITAVHNLKIKDDLGRGDKLDATTLITNSASVVRSFIPEAYAPLIGKMELDAILKADAVIYSNDEIGDDDSPQDFLRKKLFQTAGFFHAMWLAFDNNVDNEMGYLFHTPKIGGISSNFLATKMSRANGKTEQSVISREQLRLARELFRRFDYQDPVAEYVTRLKKGDAGRLGRSFYHVQAARTTKDLAFKILHQCTAVETLFATSQGELTHQLAERLSCFLEMPGQRRIDAYRRFKRAYTFRSRIAHGRTFDHGDMDELTELSISCDDFLRRSLNRLLDDPKLMSLFETTESMDNYFLEQILGAA